MKLQAELTKPGLPRLTLRILASVYKRSYKSVAYIFRAHIEYERNKMSLPMEQRTQSHHPQDNNLRTQSH